MASVQFGGGISNIVGSHAGNTFSKNKGGAYMKRKPHGVVTNSETQTLVRTQMAQASQYFTHTLTNAERAAWATFAATYPVTNRLGNTVYLSAQQMFCKLSCNLLGDGATILSAPPITTAVGTCSALLIAAVSGSPGTLHIQPTGAGVGIHDRCVLYVSPPFNPGRSFVSSQLRRMGSSWPFGTNSNISVAYLDVFGLTPTAASQRIIVRAFGINESTGIMSAGFQALDNWA